MRQSFANIPIHQSQIVVQRVRKAGMSATQINVDAAGAAPIRHLPDLLRLLDEAALPPHTVERAGSIFRRLATAEGEIHGIAPEDAHFHELSGIDTLVDVVGVVEGLRALAIERLLVSPLNVGSGTVRTAHGILPVPAPATTRLLAGFSVYAQGEPGERVTPTGAALAAELGEPAAHLPPMRLERCGYGAGHKEFASPNVTRLLLGESTADEGMRSLTLLDCNIDDMSPELYGYVLERLFELGALDAFVTPIVMKKGRPAAMLSVLAAPELAAQLRSAVFTETTTLGIRQTAVERHALPRSERIVSTQYGPIRLKVAHRPGGVETVAPEYEDCRAAAIRAGVPLQVVFAATLSVDGAHRVQLSGDALTATL